MRSNSFKKGTKQISSPSQMSSSTLSLPQTSLNTHCIKCSNLLSQKEKQKLDKLPTPYICPICTLSSFDPWTKHVSFILKPFQLNSNAPTIAYFDYLPTQTEDFLLIRCLQITESGYDLKWPRKAQILLNDKPLIDAKGEVKHKNNKGIAIFPLFTNDKASSKKTTMFAFNLFIQQKNKLSISYSSKNKAIFYFSVDTIKSRKLIDDIIKDTQTLRDVDKIKGLVGIENEVKIVKEKIDLIDVYTGVHYVKIPARGINCIHLNVFDLEKFLLFNQKTRKCICPICNKLTGEVYIDGFVSDKLKQVPKLIGLMTDNNYNFIEDIIDDQVNEKSHESIKPKEETIIISDDDDEEEDKSKCNKKKDKEVCNHKENKHFNHNSNQNKLYAHVGEQYKYLNKKRNRSFEESKVAV